MTLFASVFQTAENDSAINVCRTLALVNMQIFFFPSGGFSGRISLPDERRASAARCGRNKTGWREREEKYGQEIIQVRHKCEDCGSVRRNRRVFQHRSYFDPPCVDYLLFCRRKRYSCIYHCRACDTQPH